MNSSKNISSPPTLNNMGGANPHKAKTLPVSNYWCGFDYLILTVCGNFAERWATDAAKDKNWRGAEPVAGRKMLREILVEYRQKAIDTGEAVPIPELNNCLIHPDGGWMGRKKRLHFKLELGCGMVLLADQSKYVGDWPNIKVEISGEHCLCYDGGAVEAYKHALDFVEFTLGASIHKERVGRVDFCADFPGVDMKQVIQAAESKWWTCRSNLYHPYLRPGATSLYWGSGNCILRVYDKMGEMREKDLKGNPAKYLHMIKKRWGGSEPLFAVRVEYQIKSESLRAFGVRDFDSLMDKGGDLIRYLIGCDNVTFDRWNKKKKKYITTPNARWFRLLTAKPEKHVEKNITHPFWKLVQDVFTNNYAHPEPIISINPDEADIISLMKQCFGVAEAAIAAKGFYLPWKETVSPVKHPQPTYEQFERFTCMMFRCLAVQSDRWTFDEKLEIPEQPKTLEGIYEQFLLDLGPTKKRV